MRNLIITFLLIFFVSITYSSCKKNNNTQDIYKVVMLAEGNTFDDMSFLQSCKTGMELAKKDFNLTVVYDIDNATDNYQERVDVYGDQDFDLIIAIGYMWTDAVSNAAKTYSNSDFILVDTELSTAQSNVVSILFEVDEAAYPLGFLSAWWADTYDSDPKLGFVGALDIPQIRQFTEPYNKGANRYNEKYGKTVDTLGAYAGDFFNMELGMHIADSLIALGADVIFGVGSATGNGSLLQAKEKGRWGIGVDVDQYYSFPEVSDILISSVIKGLDISIYNVTQSFVDGSFPGGEVYKGRLVNNGVSIAPFHDNNDMIADSIKIEVINIQDGIIDGSISTGW